MFTLHWKCAFVTCKTTLTVNCNCSCTAPARPRTYLCSCTLIFYLLLYPSESTHLNVQCTQISVCTYTLICISIQYIPAPSPLSVSAMHPYLELVHLSIHPSLSVSVHYLPLYCSILSVPIPILCTLVFYTCNPLLSVHVITSSSHHIISWTTSVPPLVQLLYYLYYPCILEFVEGWEELSFYKISTSRA